MSSLGDPSNRFAEALRRRRAMRVAAADLSEHLSDDMLQQLVDGSSGAVETAAARTHIAGCLECLNAYSEFGALWEGSFAPASSLWQRAADTLRRVIRTPIPAWVLPVAAVVPVAALAIFWLRLSTTIATNPAPPRAPTAGLSVTALSDKICVDASGDVSRSGQDPGRYRGSPTGTISRIVRASEGAVVQVVPFGKEGKPRHCASGFFITEDGTVLTAAHVVQGARDIFVKILNGAVFPVDAVLALDSELDVAVLKVSGHGLPTLRLADSDLITVGEPVLTIGSPFGLQNSVSTGIVSGVRRKGEHLLIQTTAPISPGSSGGPLLNQSGEAIGIATSSVGEAQNINFAIPINEVRRVRIGPGSKTDAEKAVQAYLTGVLYLNKQDYANAEKSLLEATRFDPKHVNAWLDLGSAYYYLRLRDKEGDAYRTAVKLQPTNGQAHYLLGTWYEDAGQFERAVVEYRTAVKIDPLDDGAWFDLGELELILGRKSSALEAHEHLKALNQGLALRLHRLIELSEKAAPAR
jgi:hypothetical protein